MDVPHLSYFPWQPFSRGVVGPGFGGITMATAWRTDWQVWNQGGWLAGRWKVVGDEYGAWGTAAEMVRIGTLEHPRAQSLVLSSI
jgi:hypothetical protein